MAQVQERVIFLPGQEDRGAKLVKRCIEDQIEGTYLAKLFGEENALENALLVHQRLIMRRLLHERKVDTREIFTGARRMAESAGAIFDENAFSNSLLIVESQCTQLEAMLGLLKRIRQRCQENFRNRLVIEYDIPDIIFKWLNSPVTYVCEVSRERRLLRPQKVRGLFGITPSLGRQFYGGDLNNNMIYCAVAEPSILSIVEEELRIYATVVKAAGVKFAEVEEMVKIKDVVFSD